MGFLLAAFGFIRDSWIGRALAAAVGVLVAVLLIFSAGKRAARKDQRLKNLEGWIDAKKSADKTADEIARGLDGISDDDLNRRLRDSGRLRD